MFHPGAVCINGLPSVFDLYFVPFGSDVDIITARPGCTTAATGVRTRVPFGLTLEDGVLHAPREVPLGDACGCVCPGCRAPLAAKHAWNGGVIPHFAHAPGSLCATGFETAVHLAAKQLIATECQVFLPMLEAVVERVDRANRLYRLSELIAPSGPQALDDVRLEVWCETFRTDILATPTGAGPVCVEIAVTHRVEPDKLAKLRECGMPAVEFDLLAMRDFTWEVLRQALIEGQGPVKWLYHPELESALKRLQKMVTAEMNNVAESETRAASNQNQYFDKALQRSALIEACEKLRRTAAQSRAGAFRERSWADKAELVCRGFDVPTLPSVLRLGVTYETSVNVDEDPWIWQAALFGGLVHLAAARNEPQFTLEATFQWMLERFVIVPVLQDAARIAVGAYLLALTEKGALLREGVGAYRVRVATLSAFEALQAYRRRQVTGTAWLRWERVEDWPTITTARNIALGHCGRQDLPRRWQGVSHLPSEIASESLAEVLTQMSASISLASNELLEYWIAAGFVRRA